MNIKLIKTGILGCLIGFSGGLDAMAQFKRGLEELRAVRFPTITMPTYLNKLPSIITASTALSDFYQQYPTQVKVGAAVAGTASAAGFLYYVWNRTKNTNNGNEPITTVSEPIVAIKDRWSEELKSQELRNKQKFEVQLAYKQNNETRIPFSYIRRNLLEQKERSTSSNSTTSSTAVEIVPLPESLEQNINGGLAYDQAVAVALATSAREAKGKGMSVSEEEAAIRTALEAANLNRLTSPGLDENNTALTDEDSGTDVPSGDSRDSNPQSPRSTATSPNGLSNFDESNLAPVRLEADENTIHYDLTMSDSFTSMNLEILEPLVIDENKLDEHVLNKIGQGIPYRSRIAHGNKLLYKLLFTEPFNTENAYLLQQQEYLTNIIDIMWSLFSYAVEKGEGFKEGTILVKDPNNSLYNYLLGYVGKVNPLYILGTAGITGSANPFAYERKTTHFDNRNAFGIDMRANATASAQAILPGFMTHFFFMQLDNGYLALRMEEHGITRGSDLLWHGWGAVKSLGRKLLPKIFGSNDGEDCRKERVPVDFVEMLWAAIWSVESGSTYNSPLRKVGKIADLCDLVLKNTIRDYDAERQEQIRILRQLDARYDNLHNRYGREVILTDRDLYSLEYSALLESNPEAAALLKNVATLITQAKLKLRAYKQALIACNYDQASTQWIQPEVKELMAKYWPKEQQESELLNACSEQVKNVILEYKKDLDIIISYEQAPDGIILLKFFNPELKKLKTKNANTYDPFRVQKSNIITLGSPSGYIEQVVAQEQKNVVDKQPAALSGSPSSSASSSSSSSSVATQLTSIPTSNGVNGSQRTHMKDPSEKRREEKRNKEAAAKEAREKLVRETVAKKAVRKAKQETTEAVERRIIAEQERLKQELLKKRNLKIEAFVRAIDSIMTNNNLQEQVLLVPHEKGLERLVKNGALSSEKADLWKACWSQSVSSFDRNLTDPAVERATQKIKNALYADLTTISLEKLKECKYFIRIAYTNLLS